MNELQYKDSEFDANIKTQRYYDGDRLRSAIMNMEQFYKLSQDKNLDNKDIICAYKLFEHYRRLAMCILTKDMSPSGIKTQQCVSVEYLRNLFK